MPKHPVNDADPLSVGDAAKLAGVHADTLKRWEKKGVIASFRLPNGHRRYRRGDIEALLASGASA